MKFDTSGKTFFFPPFLRMPGSILREQVYKSSVSEWDIDFPWFSRKVSTGIVMDTGFIEHNFFTKFMCDNGNTVYGVDLAPWDYRWKSDNFKYVNADLSGKLPFKAKFFDYVVSPSLLEHLGLGFYGGSVVDDGDLFAIKEFYRILKIGGKLLAQVPYGKTFHIVKSSDGRQFYRIYTKESVKKLLSDFVILELNYAIKYSDVWRVSTEDKANNMEYTTGLTPCIVRIEAEKREKKRKYKNG